MQAFRTGGRFQAGCPTGCSSLVDSGPAGSPLARFLATFWLLRLGGPHLCPVTSWQAWAAGYADDRRVRSFARFDKLPVMGTILGEQAQEAGAMSDGCGSDAGSSPEKPRHASSSPFHPG